MLLRRCPRAVSALAWVLLSCLLSCTDVRASAEHAGTVYTGTLGKQEIVLEIDPPDAGAVGGRYFYIRHHRDLPLSGRLLSTGHLQLSEGSDDDAAQPQLDLVSQPDGSWSGTWQNAEGHRLKLALKPASIKPAADEAGYRKRLAHDDPYEYVRLRGLTLKQGRTQSFMGHQLQWWVEPDSKISFFQIVDGYDAPQRERLNRVLMDSLWQEVSSFHECMRNASRIGGDYEQQVTPRLLTAGLVSVSVFTNYDCGGAHPDFGDAPINLDARTARALSLEDVVWVGRGKPFHYAGDASMEGVPRSGTEANTVDFDTFSSYRSKDFAPWLEQQLAQVYASKITPGDNAEDDCGYDDPSVWQFPSFYLTPKGVFFRPSFARAARVCEANDDWSVLPYARIAKHPGRVSLAFP